MMSTNRRGSLSTPSFRTLATLATSTTTPLTSSKSSDPSYLLIHNCSTTTTSTAHILDIATTDTYTAKKLSTRGSEFVRRAISFSQSKLSLSSSSISSSNVHNAYKSTIHSTTSTVKNTKSIASFCTIEILSYIFRHLMDRKSILNCSLVSTHWHGPARVELARIMQDMPFNGHGLVHAIRMRFAQDTFPHLSITVFDRHVHELSQLYYYSNPEIKEVFAPAYAPDMLYHLFWTFLFIDQEFRQNKARPKFTCAYFIRLLQNEGGGYPRKYFDKKCLKSIYNDIRSQPLLPAPHLIRKLRIAERLLPDIGVTIPGEPLTFIDDFAAPPFRITQSKFMRIIGSIQTEGAIRRIRQWWINLIGNDNTQIQGAVTFDSASPDISSSSVTHGTLANTESDVESGEMNHSHSLTATSQLAFSTNSIDSNSIPMAASSTAMLSSSAHISTSRHGRFSCSSTFLCRSTTLFDQTSRSKSDPNVGSLYQTYQGLNNNNNETRQSWSVMNSGYTTVGDGWHANGDGLDRIVRFPNPDKPRTLVDNCNLIRCSSVLNIELFI